MKLMMITADPSIARFAASAGVDRIFIDLESIGKQERQKNRDTWISTHTFADIENVRKSIGDTTLLVRLNPWHDGSASEIDRAIACGADCLMLPMFHNAVEVVEFCRAVDKRVPVIPLVETALAFAQLAEIARVPGVSEVFIGLNDLHISMGMTFMFEPLAQGHLDKAAGILHTAKMPFGFGGIARIGEGLLSAEKIIGEHVRLGSSSVILSRTFHRNSATLDTPQSSMDFTMEVRRLKKAFSELEGASAQTLEINRQELIALMQQIVYNIKKNKQ